MVLRYIFLHMYSVKISPCVSTSFTSSFSFSSVLLKKKVNLNNLDSGIDLILYYFNVKFYV